jgi:hypothetical protein
MHALKLKMLILLCLSGLCLAGCRGMPGPPLPPPPACLAFRGLKLADGQSWSIHEVSAISGFRPRNGRNHCGRRRNKNRSRVV